MRMKSSLMDIILHTHTLAFLGLGIVGGIISLLASIFWLWMLIDSILNPRLRGTEKIVWVLVVLLLNVLGAVIYFFIGRGRGAVGPTA